MKINLETKFSVYLSKIFSAFFEIYSRILYQKRLVKSTIIQSKYYYTIHYSVIAFYVCKIFSVTDYIQLLLYFSNLIIFLVYCRVSYTLNTMAIKFFKLIIVLSIFYIIWIVTKYYFAEDSVLFTPRFVLKNLLNKSENHLKFENYWKYTHLFTRSSITPKGMSATTKTILNPSTPKTSRQKTTSKKATAIVQWPNCSFWKHPSRVEFNGSSRFHLDSNRFLYPALIWGPNNHIKGLRQAVYISIKLNR